MKLLICGGREFRDWIGFLAVIGEVCRNHEPEEVIEGGAHGCDALARRWAAFARIKLTTVKADWKTHGKRAGPMRNQKMVDMKPDVVVAFPGGRGTADTVARARKAGIPVVIAH